MAKTSTNAEIPSVGNLETLGAMMVHMGTEEWDFTCESKNGIVSVKYGSHDGDLILRSNGTWDLV